MFSMERTRKLMIALYIVAGLAAVVALIALGSYGHDPSTLFQDAVLVSFLSLGAAITLGLIRKDVLEELRFLETELNRDAKKKDSGMRRT